MTEYKKVRATMVEKRGVCESHKVGDSYIIDWMLTPEEGRICPGILLPMQPWIVACSSGATSWEKNEPDKFYISCISKKGTVWKIERVE